MGTGKRARSYINIGLIYPKVRGRTYCFLHVFTILAHRNQEKQILNSIFNNKNEIVCFTAWLNQQKTNTNIWNPCGFYCGQNEASQKWPSQQKYTTLGCHININYSSQKLLLPLISKHSGAELRSVEWPVLHDALVFALSLSHARTKPVPLKHRDLCVLK